MKYLYSLPENMIFDTRVKPLILIDTAIVGGPGRGLFQLLRGFEKRSIPYLLCNFKYPKPKSREFVAEVRRNRFPFEQLLQRSVFDPRPLVQFFRIARDGGYTVVQSHGYKSHFVAGLVSRMLGLPWIAFTHGWTAEDRKVRIYHSLDRFMLRFATVVIAVSPALFRTFSSVRGENRRTELLLNAVDKNALPGRSGAGAVRAKYAPRDDDILIGCIGRLSYEKGQDVLLRALAEVRADCSKIRCVFLGDGPERERLGKLVQTLGLAENVFFCSHDTAVRDYYEAMDLLVLPSRSEGLPNVVLEAMAFGVPVIATDVGAVKEIITSGRTGWIVPPENDSALARAIADGAADKGRRQQVGESGRRSLSPKFCPEARVEKVLELYQEICSRVESAPADAAKNHAA